VCAFLAVVCEDGVVLEIGNFPHFPDRLESMCKHQRVTGFGTNPLQCHACSGKSQIDDFDKAKIPSFPSRSTMTAGEKATSGRPKYPVECRMTCLSAFRPRLDSIRPFWQSALEPESSVILPALKLPGAARCLRGAFLQ